MLEKIQCKLLKIFLFLSELGVFTFVFVSFGFWDISIPSAYLHISMLSAGYLFYFVSPVWPLGRNTSDTQRWAMNLQPSTHKSVDLRQINTQQLNSRRLSVISLFTQDQHLVCSRPYLSQVISLRDADFFQWRKKLFCYVNKKKNTTPELAQNFYYLARSWVWRTHPAFPQQTFSFK